jgi:sigma-B regulation protein RsbU (phosphoserine phosphatase)
MEPKVLENTGPPVGLLPSDLFTSECEEASIQLSPGDRIYIYTDGIAEAINDEDHQFGTEQILEILTEVSTKSLDEGISVLLERLQTWCGEHGMDDDVSILSLEIGSQPS